MTTKKNNLNSTAATAINLSVSENLKNKLQIEKNNYVTARSSRLQPGVVDKILTKIKENFKLENNEEAASILAILFQQGGTARSCDGNMSIRIFDQEIKLAQIRKILKENSCNKGERKLALTLLDRISLVEDSNFVINFYASNLFMDQAVLISNSKKQQVLYDCC